MIRQLARAIGARFAIDRRETLKPRIADDEAPLASQQTAAAGGIGHGSLDRDQRLGGLRRGSQTPLSRMPETYNREIIETSTA